MSSTNEPTGLGLGGLLFVLFAGALCVGALGSSSTRRYAKSPEAIEAERLTEKRRELAARAEEESNFLDPEFQKTAAAKALEILALHRDNWRQECREVYEDRPLLTSLQQNAPHVLPWLQARLVIITLAEQALTDTNE